MRPHFLCFCTCILESAFCLPCLVIYEIMYWTKGQKRLILGLQIPGGKDGDKIMITRRNTKQRQLVLQAVQSRKDHPTAEQIYEEVHEWDAKISSGTVYRNLNCLSEDGVICHVRVPGADRYDLRTDLHYHMFCLKCKKVIDLPYPYQSYLDAETMERSGYLIMRHRLIFGGICPDCRKREPNLEPEKPNLEPEKSDDVSDNCK